MDKLIDREKVSININSWLLDARRLPGKALHVAIQILLLRSVSKSTHIVWRASDTRSIKLSRYTLYRALERLEKGKLISLHRCKGKPPVVTILEENFDSLTERLQ